MSKDSGVHPPAGGSRVVRVRRELALPDWNLEKWAKSRILARAAAYSRVVLSGLEESLSELHPSAEDPEVLVDLEIDVDRPRLPPLVQGILTVGVKRGYEERVLVYFYENGGLKCAAMLRPLPEEGSAEFTRVDIHESDGGPDEPVRVVEWLRTGSRAGRALGVGDLHAPGGILASETSAPFRRVENWRAWLVERCLTLPDWDLAVWAKSKSLALATAYCDEVVFELQAWRWSSEPCADVPQALVDLEVHIDPEGRVRFVEGMLMIEPGEGRKEIVLVDFYEDGSLQCGALVPGAGDGSTDNAIMAIHPSGGQLAEPTDIVEWLRYRLGAEGSSASSEKN